MIRQKKKKNFSMKKLIIEIEKTNIQLKFYERRYVELLEDVDALKDCIDKFIDIRTVNYNGGEHNLTDVLEKITDDVQSLRSEVKKYQRYKIQS